MSNPPTGPEHREPRLIDGHVFGRPDGKAEAPKKEYPVSTPMPDERPKPTDRQARKAAARAAGVAVAALVRKGAKPEDVETAKLIAAAKKEAGET